MFIALMMLLGIIVPTTLSAQHTDGFFSGGSEIYENRDGDLYFTVNTQDFLGYVTFTVNTQDFEDPGNNSLPLGSGMAVLLAAGAGYVTFKRKEEQK